MFLPPMLMVLLAILAVFLFQKAGLPTVVVFVLSIVAIAVVLNDHLKTFAEEYRTMSFLEGLRDNAPVAMIVTSVAIALGYLLLLKGPGQRAANSPTLTNFPAFNRYSSPPFNNSRQQNLDRQALLKALEYAV